MSSPTEAELALLEEAYRERQRELAARGLAYVRFNSRSKARGRLRRCPAEVELVGIGRAWLTPRDGGNRLDRYVTESDIEALRALDRRRLELQALGVDI